MNLVCYRSRQENTLWIPLSGGTMQCVDINTMQSLWVSEAFGGQSLSSVSYTHLDVYKRQMQRSAFESFHPWVIFGYLAAVLAVTMSTMHQLCIRDSIHCDQLYICMAIDRDDLSDS